MEQNIGYVLILGMKIGVTKVYLRFREVKMSVILKLKVLLELFNDK